MSVFMQSTPRETRNFAIECLQAGRVPFIQSSPGMGKSAMVRSIAKEYNLKLIDHRLSTSTPEDLSGLPTFTEVEWEGEKVRKASFAPFDIFPIESTPEPKGYNGWLLFLDEFNSASKTVQAAAYKLILDRMVGQHKLHEKVYVVAAGNLTTDRAIVNPLSTAMQSRVIHIEMMLDKDEFLQDVVMGLNWDHRIYAFLTYQKDYIHDFRPDHNDKTFCCPRTWEFMNSLLEVNPEVNDKRTKLFAGTITSGVATSFVTFCNIYTNLPSIEDIIRNPEQVPLPNGADVRYAISSSLMSKVTEENFKPLAEFMNRMSSEFRIMFYRGLLTKNPEFRNNPDFKKAMLELSRYLNDW